MQMLCICRDEIKNTILYKALLITSLWHIARIHYQAHWQKSI